MPSTTRQQYYLGDRPNNNGAENLSGRYAVITKDGIKSYYYLWLEDWEIKVSTVDVIEFKERKGALIKKKEWMSMCCWIQPYDEWKDKIPPPPYTTDDEEEEMTQSNVAACMDMTSVMSDFEMIDGQLVIKKKRYPYKIIKRSQQRKDKEFEALKKRVEDREKGGIDMKKFNKSLNKTMMNIYKTNPKAAKAMDRMEAMLEGMFKF